ncbi:hypothetical protein HHK36_007315 [Tetracentron sinense]|uniref:HNH nuclease domain-containing protein n=1 Tax=Tetracentron sinense TaxID=13715 RepID=A0A834ZN69_TETSI|nr:hypothetical protein HHK36_007315 [Tetracentron sinense]
MISQNVGLVQKMQPVELYDEIPEKVEDISKDQSQASANRSTQTDSLHFETTTVSDLEMVNTTVPNGGLEGNASEAIEIGSPGRISACKLCEASEEKEHMENVSLGGVSFPNAEPTFSVTMRMQPNKLCTVTSEIDDDGTVALIEADASSSIHADSLRFESVEGSINPSDLRVSKYTGRVHLYSCIPGTGSRPRPLFENFRAEELDSLNFNAVGMNKKAAFKSIKDNPAYLHVLRAFISEWNNLRPIEQKKLFGKPLQIPLTLELCYLMENINHCSGGLLKGGSKRRTTPLYDISHPLPANAVWKKIHLCNGYGKKGREYIQGYTLTDEPLCKLCQTPCTGKLAKTPEYFEDLFCKMGCFEEYRMRTSQRYLREELFQIERGVCTNCQLDCHKLVECTRPLSVARRREYIEKVAPNVASRKNLLDKLVHEPIEGNAWHADHIVPVYRGGGECRLENMRTLCVACHAEVTAAQCAERRSTRVKAKKQLKVIMNDLKNGGSTEQSDANLEGQGHLDIGESFVDDELMIKVPGSAYSGGTSTVTRSEEQQEPSKAV